MARLQTRAFISLKPSRYYQKVLLKNINNYSNEAIAYEVIKPYVGASIPEKLLKNIVEETVNFSIPWFQLLIRLLLWNYFMDLLLLSKM
jgi:hypothetical protein